MENAVDALYMAGSMLMFIVALSVAISSFSMVRAGIDNVVGYTETVDMAQDDENYVNYMKTNKDDITGTPQVTRIVGGDTIISSIYRALKENYVVYIHLDNMSSVKSRNYDGIKWNVVESEGVEYIKITVDERQTNVRLINNKDAMNNLYKEIANLNFEEKIGEYQENTQAASENKITYRIITYTQRPEP